MWLLEGFHKGCGTLCRSSVCCVPELFDACSPEDLKPSKQFKELDTKSCTKAGLNGPSEHETLGSLLRHGQDSLQIEAEVSWALKHEKPEDQQM